MAEKPTKKAADLSELDLATGVERLPELWNRHGNTILIGITIVSLAFALYTFRKNSTEATRVATEQNLTSARELLNLLKAGALDRSPEAYSNLRRQVLTEGSTALGDVLGKTEDDTARVQALLLKGDLTYAVGMMPDPPAAATRPTLKLEQGSDSLFRTAQECYQEVVTRYPTRLSDASAARLGLGAIAENNGDFEGAKGFYETIANDAAVSSTYRDTAKQRLNLLPSLSKPMRLRVSTSRPVEVAPFVSPVTQPVK